MVYSTCLLGQKMQRACIPQIKIFEQVLRSPWHLPKASFKIIYLTFQVSKLVKGQFQPESCPLVIFSGRMHSTKLKKLINSFKISLSCNIRTVQLELYSQNPSIIAPYKTPCNDSFLITNLINHNNETIMKEKEREWREHTA